VIKKEIEVTMGDYQHVSHTFEPVFDKNSKILILGSFPSVKSREQEFYYGHPMNRFWRMLSTVLEKEIPSDSSKKREFLLENHIALWDVIDSCDIIGSSDSSIKNVIPTDLSRILAISPISNIYVNGKTAKKLYDRYSESETGLKAICLPSTSPANAMFSLEKLVEEWKVILEPLGGNYED